MKNSVSAATENFIKAIYKFEHMESRDTKPGSIARELVITNAATTDMARKLALKKLIDYEKYKELKLTPAGKKMALGIIRKHRLKETFLHQVLGLTIYEIHREAEILEHLTSDFLPDKIDNFLGKPSLDPHGDPIPDEQGVILSDENSDLLSLAESDKEYEISRLSGSEKEFFEFCYSNHLLVGNTLSVNKQYDNNGMTEIEMDKIKLLLNENIKKNAATIIRINRIIPSLSGF
jgi:DtxR family Mn-dependent transcriptional regulator